MHGDVKVLLVLLVAWVTVRFLIGAWKWWKE